MRVKSFAKGGFTIIDTLVVVVLIVIIFGFVIFVSVPRRRPYPHWNCAANLKQVALAFRIWEGDNGDRYPMKVYTNQFGAPLYTNAGQTYLYFQMMSNEIGNPNLLVCPEDSSRMAATNFTGDFNDTRISYFAGLEADETAPQQLLAGDSNLTNGTPISGNVLTITATKPPSWLKPRHDHRGNIALADGSVEDYDDFALRKYIKNHSDQTNRLAMPLP